MHDRELHYLLSTRYYRLCWTEWGKSTSPAVICVHGLTRTGRDFDTLARALQDEFRVLCPDLPGRGRSEFLAEPSLYSVPAYIQALSHLLAHVAAPVAWIGTSLGGLCGMAVAATPAAPVTRLLLNDIGPFLPPAALQRIADYMANAPESFASLIELEAALRQVHAPFGRLSDEQWAAMARHSARRRPDGRIGLHYDPGITTQMLATPPQDVDLWPTWNAIRIPRLVLRGETSDLLLPDTLARMAADGAEHHTVAEAGHAPALMDAPTIDVIRRFLRGA